MDSKGVKYQTTKEMRGATTTFTSVLQRSLATYWSETPTATRVLRAMRDLGGGAEPQVDHVAFRSFDHRPLHDLILSSGHYEKVEDIVLNRGLNLKARWYRRRADSGFDMLPRIFLSDYDLGNDPEARALLDQHPPGADRSHEAYQALSERSQYAAWAYLHPPMTINHVALLCNGPFGGLRNVAKGCGVEARRAQVSRDGLLLQCSTRADHVDGYPKAFVELVERKPVVTDFIGGNVILRDGFEGDNASRIFGSTAR